jgi:transcription antitermination factor NusG
MTTQPGPWYAVWTRGRHEKHVEAILRRMGLETYLPLRREWSRRLDRKQVIEVPALPGYLFVRCALLPERRAAIKRTLGVVGLVENAGRPCPIPPAQIESLRIAVTNGTGVAEHSSLRVGERVRVTRGALAGVRGYLTRAETGSPRLVVAIDWLDRAVSVEIDARGVERDE